jgi:hypothetical protein
MRRLVWRNERALYKRKCDKSGEEIVSIYSPEKTDYKIFSNSCWHSDDWDAIEYGREYDPARSFFDQFESLMHSVPRKATNTTRNENSDFCNQTWQSKDSYLCFNVGYTQRCFYCTEGFHLADCVDCFDIKNSQYCFGSFDCNNCNNSQYIEHCDGCSECIFVYDSKGCSNVFMSSGLRNKQYFFENQQLSKEEYESKISQINFGKKSVVDELKTKFKKLKNEAVHKENSNINSENCSGDYLVQCNNCKDCFNAFKAENCTRVAGVDENSNNCSDMNIITEAEFCYEGTSMTGSKNQFGVFVVYGSNNYYCNFCDNCSDCFGCIGLNKKQYCILNKQYSQEEYNKIIPKIIEKMTTDGEWGEFFPMQISPFGYNESLAIIYYPKTKEGVGKYGAKWQDNDYSLKFDGPFYQPKDDIKEYEENEQERQSLLSGILKCETTGKAFKIMPGELAYYISMGIPIPTKHSETRFEELFLLRNPRQLHHRQCMCEEQGHGHSGRCPIEFETTYAPDRPEKIYCEKCYQQCVI